MGRAPTYMDRHGWARCDSVHSQCTAQRDASDMVHCAMTDSFIPPLYRGVTAVATFTRPPLPPAPRSAAVARTG